MENAERRGHRPQWTKNILRITAPFTIPAAVIAGTHFGARAQSSDLLCPQPDCVDFTPKEIYPGDTGTVTWNVKVPSSNQGATLVRVDDPAVGYQTIFFINCSQKPTPDAPPAKGSCPFPVVSNLQPGQYETVTALRYSPESAAGEIHSCLTVLAKPKQPTPNTTRLMLPLVTNAQNQCK